MASVFSLPDDMMAEFEFVPEDEWGNPLPKDPAAPPPTTTVSDDTILTARVNATGNVEVESATGKLATVQLTVTSGALKAIQDLEVVAGSATQLGLNQVGGLKPRATPVPTPTPTPAP